MALIKFINQVTKRLNAFWNTSLQLSPGEISEGPVQLVNDIGNDLIRSFQGSIFVNIALPVGTTSYRPNDVIAALHASVPTLGNDPARYILDRDDIEYIEISNFHTGYLITATAGEVYNVESGIAVTGTGPSFLSYRSPVFDAGAMTVGGTGVVQRNTYSTNVEFKNVKIRLSSDQISSSVAGGLPMPEYLAAFLFVTCPAVMAAPATVEILFTYQIDICYKRPYQALQNNNRSLTSF
jgi:hypothetical protein